MNIIERGKAFVQHLWELANRSAWDWRRCPRCGSSDTSKCQQRFGIQRKQRFEIQQVS